MVSPYRFQIKYAHTDDDWVGYVFKIFKVDLKESGSGGRNNSQSKRVISFLLIRLTADAAAPTLGVDTNLTRRPLVSRSCLWIIYNQVDDSLCCCWGRADER